MINNQTPIRSAPATLALSDLIPLPVSITPAAGMFIVTSHTTIFVEPGSAEISAIGSYLANKLNPAVGETIHVLPHVLPTAADRQVGSFYLTTVGGDPTLGDEGYQLTITPDWITLLAYKPAGLFRGIQTIRQLLPPTMEAAQESAASSDVWIIAAGVIRDYPRFAWRGAMLDVARHFFSVADVKRYIDALVLYKINYFHLHLTDDQGWRIAIKSWPLLTTHGGSTEVGGGTGGYYTQADYSDIVAYAQQRYLTVVPEIDMPGHTSAALASYAQLNCDGKARELYTGIEVGFSSLCTDSPTTLSFINDVIGELAALTPGPYIHIGGDESAATPPDAYINFINQVQAIVKAHGKQPIGWEEIARGTLLPGTIVQHWKNDGLAETAVAQGSQVIISPATKAYLDMQYDSSTPLGLHWAAYVSVQDGYQWDPATQISNVPQNAILGIEAPLWSETLQTLADVEYMTFPRLPGDAEIGWSPAAGRSWDTYKIRLGAQASRWEALGINFYRASTVPWQ